MTLCQFWSYDLAVFVLLGAWRHHVKSPATLLQKTCGVHMEKEKLSDYMETSRVPAILICELSLVCSDPDSRMQPHKRPLGKNRRRATYPDEPSPN